MGKRGKKHSSREKQTRRLETQHAGKQEAPDTKNQKTLGEQNDTASTAPPTGQPDKNTSREKAVQIRDWIDFCLSLISSIIAIVGIPIAVVQIMQGNAAYRQAIEQFEESGPRYSWFYLDAITPLTTIKDGVLYSQPVVGAVISNTGRTGDTPIAMQRATEREETLMVCMPGTDQAGIMNPDEPAVLGLGKPRLEPGDSRVIFFIGPLDHTAYNPQSGAHLHGSPFEITHDMTLYSASGREYHPTFLTNVSKTVINYYESTNLNRARIQCANLANEHYNGIKTPLFSATEEEHS